MPTDQNPDRTAAIYAALEGLQGTTHHLPSGTRQAVAEHLARALPAVPSAAVPPTQAALRDRIRRAVCEAEGFAWDSDMLEPDEYGEVADAVLAVLPAPVDRAAVLLWAADQIDAETRQAKADGVLEPDKYRPCRDASAQMRRLAEAPQPETQAGHVCKPGASTYFCPTSGETESGCHGGFGVCCDRPELHAPAVVAQPGKEG